MIQAVAFYLFATVVIASAVMTIASRNPVHSVLWLILAFFNAAGLMLLLGAEFIALLLVIVYVGAVAVLFLFVVMMLDVDFGALRSGFTRNLPFGILLALVLLAEIVIAVSAWKAGPALSGAAPRSAGPAFHALTAMTISARRTSASSIPNGRLRVKPERSAPKSTSSIITTNRNSTATAPT